MSILAELALSRFISNKQYRYRKVDIKPLSVFTINNQLVLNFAKITPSEAKEVITSILNVTNTKNKFGISMRNPDKGI